MQIVSLWNSIAARIDRLCLRGVDLRLDIHVLYHNYSITAMRRGAFLLLKRNMSPELSYENREAYLYPEI